MAILLNVDISRSRSPFTHTHRYDDLVICEESRLEVEQQLDRWREVLEGNGLRISRKNIENLRPAGSWEEVCLAGLPIPCTNSFKYLGSTIEATG